MTGRGHEWVTRPGRSRSDSALSTGRKSQPQGPAAYLVLSPASSTVEAGQPESFTAVDYNGDGASLGDVTATTAFTISGPGSCSAGSCSSTQAGTYMVSGTYGQTSSTAALLVTPAPRR